MWKLATLLLGCLAIGVHSDCQCYETQPYTGKSAPISNSYDPADFSACYVPCSFVAYTGNDTYGWSELTFRWSLTTNSGGLIQIFDGDSDSGTPIIHSRIAEGENVLDGSAKNLIKSSSPRITIKYTQSGTGANMYYGAINAVSGLQPVTIPTTTTAMPTTRFYNSSVFSRDPHLISHDILIAINQKTSGGIVALNSMNSIALNFVHQLSTTTDVKSVRNARISLATLTPYDPYYSIQGEIWKLNETTFSNGLPQSGVSIEGNFDDALIGLAQLAFKVNTNGSTDSRPYAQRTIVLITAEWPTTNANLNETYVKPKFDVLGANLLVVGFNLTDIEQGQVLRPNRWYNAINTVKTNTAAVANFVNPFFFNDGSQNNYWCPKVDVKDHYDFDMYLLSTFFEPFNYQGPNGQFADDEFWSQFPGFVGQSNMYCNFANNKYVYTMPPNVTRILVEVYYELEAGKDTLSFYDSSNAQITSFTGYDISGASFYTNTNTLTAIFTSDSQSLYRGFYVTIYPV